MSLEPANQDVIALFNQGLQQHQEGNLDAAIVCYQEALTHNPNYSPAMQYLGVIAAQKNNFHRSLELISKAIFHNPLDASAYLNRGLAHTALKNHVAALEDFKKAQSIAPKYCEAFFNEGNALQELRYFPESIVAYKNALALAPAYAQAYNNLGNAQQEIKQFDDALISYKKAIELEPNYAEAYFNCGILFQALKDYKKSIVFFDQCLALNPEFIEALINKGESYTELVEINQALHCYQQALKLEPNYLEAIFAKALSQIPKIYSIDSDPKTFRNNFIREINALHQLVNTHEYAEGYKVVGSHQPFFLAYQEENNVDVLSAYGQICSKLMSNLPIVSVIDEAASTSKKKISLGIISGHFRTHSVWNAITKGWLTNIQQNDFDIHMFYLDDIVDTETEIAKSLSTSFIQGNLSIEEWVKIILAKHLDIILYPEIGMDRLTCQLASLRLAPKQLVTWGHPETTGLPNIDYFISAENFENSQSQENYSETLINLPHLGCFYTPYKGPIQEVVAEEFNLNPNHPILLCPGATFKYAPQFDCVLLEITKQVKNAQLIFFNFPDMPIDILKERLSILFARNGLTLENHVFFQPKLVTEKFYGLMQIADVFIDTIGFSGFNTAIQAIQCNLPVVTYEGKFMRGRLASGILKRIGLNELITPNIDAFIAKVVQLGNDPEYRNRMKREIASSKNILFEDPLPVLALNQFLLEIAR